MLKRTLSTLFLLAYGALLIRFMVFKDIPVIHIGHLMFNFGGGGQPGEPNLIPFKTIIPYLLGAKGGVIAVGELVGNIVPLMPVGFFAPIAYSKMNWRKSFILALATGLSIEGLQLILRVGIFDVDDVLLNGLGVMLGYSAFLICAKLLRRS